MDAATPGMLGAIATTLDGYSLALCTVELDPVQGLPALHLRLVSAGPGARYGDAHTRADLHHANVHYAGIGREVHREDGAAAPGRASPAIWSCCSFPTPSERSWAPCPARAGAWPRSSPATRPSAGTRIPTARAKALWKACLCRKAPITPAWAGQGCPRL